jgi:hypothetical protein
MNQIIEFAKKLIAVATAKSSCGNSRLSLLGRNFLATTLFKNIEPPSAVSFLSTRKQSPTTMNTSLNNSKFRLNRMLRQSLLAGIISAAALASGWAPGLYEQSPNLVFGSAAQAQDISSEEITSYARAVLAIEPRRVEAYNEIKGMAGGSVPRVVCNETQEINRLSGSVRGIAVNYCQQAKKVIETNGLTVSRFNQLTLLQQANPAVKQRIQAELLRLQQAGNQ